MRENFIYQLREKDGELYIARLSLEQTSPLQLKKVEDWVWEDVRPWDENGAGKTTPKTGWLGRNEMKNHLYINGIKNYQL